jgi:type I restriction enzyme S subunit
VVGHHDTAISRGPTIVVGRKGSFGEVNFSPSACWPIDTTYYIDESATEADLRWLSHRLTSLGLNQLNRAATIPGLNREDAYQKRLMLPPIAEQRRIAEILDRAEALRAKRRAALAQLDELTRSFFLDIFVPKTGGGVGFPQPTLGEIAEFIDYRGISPNKQPQGVRLITARNIKRGWFEEEPKEFIPADEYEGWMRRGMPRAGDVLFTTEGHTLGSAAKLPQFEKAALAQRLIALQPKGRVVSDYLLQVILGTSFQDEVRRRSTGSAARGISSKQLAQISIPLPPISLQEEFRRRISAVEQLKALHRSSLKQLDSAFDTLLHRSFWEEL